MEPPIITKPCNTCTQFEDFKPSKSALKVYYSEAGVLTVTCPDGTTTTTPLDAGIATYTLNFTLGFPPYPNLVTYCGGKAISIPVPDNATQSDLDALIAGMLSKCVSAIAKVAGCPGGVFYNTQQSVAPCPDYGIDVAGSLPIGVYLDADNQNLIIPAGLIQSTISVADANAKAILILNEIFSTGNAICQGPT